MLLATYNHWLKKANPKRMLELGKLGLSVEFQTVKPNDAAIDPAVMLTIVDAQGQALYSWNGEHCVGGVGALKDMATSMWLSMPTMLAMLRARHVYMAISGTDLPQSCQDEAMCQDHPKTTAAWAVGTKIEFKGKYKYALLDDDGLDYLKEIYEVAAQPDLHRMVCTQAVVQLTGVTPLVASGGAALVTTNSQVVGDKADLNVTVGVNAEGLSFTLKDYWMELSYGWEAAGLVAVMSWPDLKLTFGLDDKVFHAFYGINGSDAEDALRQSLRLPVTEEALAIPEGAV
jgi:hypothetical protein